MEKHKSISIFYYLSAAYDGIFGIVFFFFLYQYTAGME